MDSTYSHECFGHFSFNLPDQLRPVRQFNSGAGDVTLYFGRDVEFRKVEVTLVASEVDQLHFESATKKRADEIASVVHGLTGASTLVEKEESDSHGRVVLKHYARKNIEDALIYELHTLVEGMHVALQETSYERKDGPSVLLRLQWIASTLSVNHSQNSPRKGLCLGDLQIDAGQDYAVARVLYRGSGAKFGGVLLELEMDTLPSQEILGMVERGEANLVGLGVRPRVLRMGRRDLAGDKGEEWLGVFKAEGHPLHSFYAETSTSALKMGAARLQVELHAGEAKNDMDVTPSPLSDMQALELWDGLMGSIKQALD